MWPNFLSLQDITAQDIKTIFSETTRLKKFPYSSQLKNKTILLLFAKPSTRTRVSFEVAINQLGGDDIFLPMGQLQISRGETIQDTARVLSRYADGIVARLFAHQTLLDLADAASIPVINGLTDLLHPCQALTDLFTIQEKRGKLKGLKLTFLGDGNNNVTHSLMHACSKLGVHLRIASPREYHPHPQIIKNFHANAKKSRATLQLLDDPKKAVKGAHVLYTDTWTSMGEEKQAYARELALSPYQLNSKLLKLAPKALVMHDLPAHRGKEITSEVMDGPQSVIFDQAENRLHVEKAILSLMFR